ncbi:MAG: signal peptidase II [Lachnospiraceae bacterium]|nr:signal peptidase II [Lachnospiraceae bacterium]
MKTKKGNLKVLEMFFDVVIIGILIFLDQYTKHIAVLNLKDHDAIRLIDGVLELQYLENRGAAFGMMQNQKIFFVTIAIVILIAILYVLIKSPAQPKYRLLNMLLVFIASGAVGNMIDRIGQNYVVDFIYVSLIDFPIFNVADIYVTCGTIVLVLAILFYYKENDFGFLSLKPRMVREVKYTDHSKEQK